MANSKGTKVGRIKWSKYDHDIQGIRGIIETYDDEEEELPFAIQNDSEQMEYEQGRMVKYVENEDGPIPHADDVEAV
jgi:hypothetical protein